MCLQFKKKLGRPWNAVCITLRSPLRYYFGFSPLSNLSKRRHWSQHLWNCDGLYGSAGTRRRVSSTGCLFNVQRGSRTCVWWHRVPLQQCYSCTLGTTCSPSYRLVRCKQFCSCYSILPDRTLQHYHCLHFAAMVVYMPWPGLGSSSSSCVA